jgi:hypothetical protein
MTDQERYYWISSLWTFSAISAFALGIAMPSDFAPQGGPSPLIMFWIAFVIMIIAWLFRVTYLAGTNRRGRR